MKIIARLLRILVVVFRFRKKLVTSIINVKTYKLIKRREKLEISFYVD